MNENEILQTLTNAELSKAAAAHVQLKQAQHQAIQQMASDEEATAAYLKSAGRK